MFNNIPNVDSNFSTLGGQGSTMGAAPENLKFSGRAVLIVVGELGFISGWVSLNIGGMWEGFCPPTFPTNLKLKLQVLKGNVRWCLFIITLFFSWTIKASVFFFIPIEFVNLELI